MTRTVPKRLHLLDALRGVAALSVVVYHWRHFFLPSNKEGLGFVEAEAPFFHQLAFVYDNGRRAVDLFFCLSGFIFFWLYEREIANRSISFARFFVARFSRLYPLHLAMLIVVAVVQAAHLALSNTYFVYDCNDPYHFLLNLLFASAWGLEKDFSFNGPSWSVSVEVLLYGLFFLVCWRRLTGNLMLLAVSFGGSALVAKFNGPLALGVACFFAGGLSFRAYAVLVSSRFNARALIIVFCGAAIAWLVTLYGPDYLWPSTATYDRLWRQGAIYLLYPLTLVCLALAEARWAVGKKLGWLGDISYSVYLMHFPLQLITATVVLSSHMDPGIFYSRTVFVVFFIILISMSLASHRYFERPAQRWIRSTFADHGRPKTATGNAVRAPTE